MRSYDQFTGDNIDTIRSGHAMEANIDGLWREVTLITRRCNNFHVRLHGGRCTSVDWSLARTVDIAQRDERSLLVDRAISNPNIIFLPLNQVFLTFILPDGLPDVYARMEADFPVRRVVATFRTYIDNNSVHFTFHCGSELIRPGYTWIHMSAVHVREAGHSEADIGAIPANSRSLHAASPTPLAPAGFSGSRPSFPVHFVCASRHYEGHAYLTATYSVRAVRHVIGHYFGLRGKDILLHCKSYVILANDGFTWEPGMKVMILLPEDVDQVVQPDKPESATGYDVTSAGMRALAVNRFINGVHAQPVGQIYMQINTNTFFISFTQATTAREAVASSTMYMVQNNIKISPPLYVCAYRSFRIPRDFTFGAMGIRSYDMVEFAMELAADAGDKPAYPICRAEALDQADIIEEGDLSPIMVRYPSADCAILSIIIDISEAQTPELLAKKLKTLVPEIALLPAQLWTDQGIKCFGFKHIKVPYDNTLWSAGVRENDLVRIRDTPAGENWYETEQNIKKEGASDSNESTLEEQQEDNTAHCIGSSSSVRQTDRVEALLDRQGNNLHDGKLTEDAQSSNLQVRVQTRAQRLKSKFLYSPPECGISFPAMGGTFGPYPCQRANCPCPASWNGGPFEFCSKACRNGIPCPAPTHKGEMSVLQRQYRLKQRARTCDMPGCMNKTAEINERFCGREHELNYAASAKPATDKSRLLTEGTGQDMHKQSYQINKTERDVKETEDAVAHKVLHDGHTADKDQQVWVLIRIPWNLQPDSGWLQGFYFNKAATTYDMLCVATHKSGVTATEARLFKNGAGVCATKPLCNARNGDTFDLLGRLRGGAPIQSNYDDKNDRLSPLQEYRRVDNRSVWRGNSAATMLVASWDLGPAPPQIRRYGGESQANALPTGIGVTIATPIPRKGIRDQPTGKLASSTAAGAFSMQGAAKNYPAVGDNIRNLGNHPAGEKITARTNKIAGRNADSTTGVCVTICARSREEELSSTADIRLDSFNLFVEVCPTERMWMEITVSPQECTPASLATSLKDKGKILPTDGNYFFTIAGVPFSNAESLEQLINLNPHIQTGATVRINVRGRGGGPGPRKEPASPRRGGRDRLPDDFLITDDAPLQILSLMNQPLREEFDDSNADALREIATGPKSNITGLMVKHGVSVNDGEHHSVSRLRAGVAAGLGLMPSKCLTVASAKHIVGNIWGHPLPNIPVGNKEKWTEYVENRRRLESHRLPGEVEPEQDTNTLQYNTSALEKTRLNAEREQARKDKMDARLRESGQLKQNQVEQVELAARAAKIATGSPKKPKPKGFSPSTSRYDRPADPASSRSHANPFPSPPRKPTVQRQAHGKGTLVEKSFGDYGRFQGRVTTYNEETKLYRIKYSDEDSEDLMESEVTSLLAEDKQPPQPPRKKQKNISALEDELEAMKARIDQSLQPEEFDVLRARIESLQDKVTHTYNGGPKQTPQKVAFGGGSETQFFGSNDAAGNIYRATEPRVTTLAKAWLQEATQVAREDNLQLFANDAVPPLSAPSDWRLWVNFPATPEFMPDNYCVSKISGMHFVTAVVELLAKNHLFLLIDEAGTRTFARMPGQHEVAAELLDMVYATALSTAAGNVIRFSPAALANLAGKGTLPPAPESLALLFGQLLGSANITGEIARRLNNAEENYAPQGNQEINKTVTNGNVVVELTEEEKDEILQTQWNLAPYGTSADTLRKAIAEVSRCKGKNFHAKIVAYRKSIAGALSASKGLVATSAAAGHLVVAQTDSLALFHISLQKECLQQGQNTKGNYNWLNTNTTPFKKCLQAISTRRFSDPSFSFLVLLPNIGSKPTAAVLKAAFGEAETAILEGHTLTTARTEEDDAICYPWLAMALTYFQAVEVPNFDPQFMENLRFFSDGMSRWTASAVPLQLITRALCRVFMEAEASFQQASVQSSFADDTDVLFRDTKEIQDAKNELDTYCRADQQQLALRMQRANAWAGIPTSGGEAQLSRKSVEDMVAKIMQQNKGANNQGQKRSQPQHDKKTNAKKAKRDGRKTPDQTDQRSQMIDLAKWNTKYGKVNGVRVCFFHLNKPGGCTMKDGACKQSHSLFPADYQGKKLAMLPKDQQQHILKGIKKA